VFAAIVAATASWIYGVRCMSKAHRHVRQRPHWQPGRQVTWLKLTGDSEGRRWALRGIAAYAAFALLIGGMVFLGG
jgi:hypothetical protein